VKTADALAARVEEERGYAWRFAVATVILTPVAIGFITLIIEMLAGPRTYGYGSALSPWIAVDLYFVYALVVLLLRRDRRHGLPRGPMALAVGALLALLALSWAIDRGRPQLTFAGIAIAGDGLPAPVPALAAWHGPLTAAYALLAVLYCGALGVAYEPRDEYYLGVFGKYDDPTTLADDIDRAHVLLSIPALAGEIILRSYASIFASAWLWRGLDAAALSAAAAVLDALATGDREEVTRVLDASDLAVLPRALRALVRLDLVRPRDRGGFRLSAAGERLLSDSRR
jgi:hypothetical protein